VAPPAQRYTDSAHQACTYTSPAATLRTPSCRRPVPRWSKSRFTCAQEPHPRASKSR